MSAQPPVIDEIELVCKVRGFALPPDTAEAFEHFFRWRKRIPKIMPITFAKLDVHCTSLFPEQFDDGTKWDLKLQARMVYSGLSAGHDAIGEWSLHPLGCLLHAVLWRKPDPGNDFLYEWTEELGRLPVRLTYCNDAVALDRTNVSQALELFKLQNFISYFMSPNLDRSRWELFPAEAASGLPAPGVAREMLEMMLSMKRRMARGFLLYGPAGTGKTTAIQVCSGHLHLAGVWGEGTDGKPIVGTGAVLKGNLQGDLEMRVIALFKRAEAAPWQPTAISIDEIDFTAPSRQSHGSQESGGNLWLQQLSDGSRLGNVTFFATTNVPDNVLEQLVDRLDKVFVGVWRWNSITELLQNTGMLQDLPVPRVPLLDEEDPAWAPNWPIKQQPLVLGMSPRQIGNIHRMEDLERLQLGSNPWPTNTRGPLPLFRLLEISNEVLELEQQRQAKQEPQQQQPQHRQPQQQPQQQAEPAQSAEARSVDIDCLTLYLFLVRAAMSNLLSGRMLIDLTGLRQRIITVDVELLTRGNESGKTQPAPETLLILKDMHVHGVQRQGNGLCYTRTYVLRDQDDQTNVWAMLVRFALFLEADHCTYVSDTFLKANSAPGSDSSDHRNRAALRVAIEQYLQRCQRAVLVVPLSLARIQQAGSSGGQLQINAREVWDQFLSGWRVRQHRRPMLDDLATGPGPQPDTTRQFFVLVASEQAEIDAVLENDTMVWQASEYRQLMRRQRSDEHQCPHCKRVFEHRMLASHFDEQNPSNLARSEAAFGCEHSGELVDQATGGRPLPYTGIRTCCGSAWNEPACPRTRHIPPRPIVYLPNKEQEKEHQSLRGWWCNHCCQHAVLKPKHADSCAKARADFLMALEAAREEQGDHPAPRRSLTSLDQDQDEKPRRKERKQKERARPIPQPKKKRPLRKSDDEKTLEDTDGEERQNSLARAYLARFGT